jgi:lysophospholipase L1-like esterase
MHQILVYADSLTWGIIPDTRRRLPFSARWPGVVEAELLKLGHAVRVIEDCLNGRRTAWEDPVKPGRNGRVGIEQRIEVNSPLALVILMLGTNDFQSMHQHNASHSAQGIAALVRAIRDAPIEPGLPTPDVLIIAPPPIETARGLIAEKFEGASDKCVGLAEAIGAWQLSWVATSWTPARLRRPASSMGCTSMRTSTCGLVARSPGLSALFCRVLPNTVCSRRRPARQ